MNRRHFVWESTAALIGISERLGAAARYDLVVKGGRVIDPASKMNALRDVAIANGRIVAVKAGIAAGGAQTLDATGKLVVSGLIDIHTHAGRNMEGPAVCLADGVTGLIDAGSQGADRIGEPVAVLKSAPQLCRALINIGRAGIIAEGDTMDLTRADVAAAKEAIGKNRDMIVGVKARLSRDVAGQNDFEVLRRAQEAASAFNLPVMIHMGQTISPLSKLMPLLKSGDIVTHLFAPPPNSIIDDTGHILPEVLAARRRGVLFDVGNGRTGHLRWDMAESILKAGFVPDTFSTDWGLDGRAPQIIDFPNVMSKFLMLGMSIDQVIACSTSHAARVFPVFHDRGTLKPGAPADIAVLDLRQGTFDFLDNFGNTRSFTQRLFPAATILAGKVVATRK
ncbi:MAG TPA: amidohydrolase/deacetylase family metallohydrolase [Bryobacteraceae bacterium]|nr:amidohydrolase/deacetylase family metallohydrolase [Bryobacteraceae bacterium]